ncbi:hypothetical protein OAB57_03260 [Bacteriovoracaceae bacterium]|nr:hypothetical protein [Bacteriovoracaceae bacterium]
MSFLFLLNIFCFDVIAQTKEPKDVLGLKALLSASSILPASIFASIGSDKIEHCLSSKVGSRQLTRIRGGAAVSLGIIGWAGLTLATTKFVDSMIERKQARASD